MRIAICSDHGGKKLKDILIPFLIDEGYEVTDFGTDSLESCDYVDYGLKVALEVSKGNFERGILICSTGIGMSIIANKVKNIRCSLISDLLSAKLTREHNDSNCLALGAMIVSSDLAKEICKVWLNTEFTYGRHLRRVDKIRKYEEAKNE